MLDGFVRTKVIATVGPSTQSPERLAGLIEAGVDVFRLNMSHMDHDTADEVIARIRRLSRRVAILVDLQGPKMRLTECESPFEVRRGDRVRLAAGRESCKRGELRVPIDELFEALDVGHALLIDDGRIRLRVVDLLEGSAVGCEVLTGGTIKSRKGVAAPDSRFVPASYLDASDKRDLRFAASRHVDFLAASYVSRAADVEAVREELGQQASEISIIAKVESRVGVENIDEIIEASYGVMVARGDLGVEMPPEEVPLAQKAIIRKSNAAGHPVVVATQMLDSMVQSPVASRAETSDVANAILDGADCLMLSNETSVGAHPVEAVRTLRRISLHVEAHADLSREALFDRQVTRRDELIARSAAVAARDLGLEAIVALTSSGRTARKIAAFRPQTPIIASTPAETIVRRLGLTWGVHCIHCEHVGRYDMMVEENFHTLVERGLLEPEHSVAVLGGVPVGISGSTNMLQISVVHEMLDRLA